MADTTTLDPPTNVTGAASPPSTSARGTTDVRGVTSARGTDAFTDLHGTKIPADDPRLKLERPRSRTLRRGPALAVAALVATAFGIALIIALTPSTPAADDPKKPSESEVNTSSPVPLPDMLRDPEDPPGAPLPRSPAAQRSLSDTTSPPLRDDLPGTSGAQRGDALHQARSEELARARGAGLFAQADDSNGVETIPTPNHSGAAGEPTGDANRAAAGVADPSRATDANMQERKNDFLARSGVSSAEYLDKSLTTPRSPYEIKAGTIIPTVLITGINSDLPGQVVAQVRENVYDTVSGNYLLIPQGSRVIAAYDSMVAWGQERVLVCWNRVIRPDGTSITLDCMPGVDLAGYAGFTDEVDNHWWRIISGAVFSSLLAATAQRSQGDVTTYQPSVSQAWAGNAAGQVNQAGQQITARNLQIQPTITVRPGFSVNVLVSKDIVLAPYSRGGAP
jgi:type IV secretion system protein TrbI